MINIHLTKEEFIEILDDRIAKGLDEKLDSRFAEFERRIKAWVEAKFDEFAGMVRDSFQRVEDRMATKQELQFLESKVDKGFNKLNTKIDIHQANTSRRLEWTTNEIIKLKKN